MLHSFIAVRHSLMLYALHIIASMIIIVSDVDTTSNNTIGI